MRVIAGTARSIPLLAPDGLHTRPTADRVKEGIFSALQFEIEGRSVLDLFGGSGQLAIEALSRGAADAVITDQDAKAVAVIRENLRRTKLTEKATVLQCEALQYLEKCDKKFHFIFLDPPYAEKLLENAIKRISEIDILLPSGIIVTERPAEKQLGETPRGLLRAKDYRYGKTAVTLFRRQETL